MHVAEPHHIIAIGASAGGMEEINSFFDHTPLDGVSYVIIQHLSSDFKSRMVELLARHSKLAVKEAEDGMFVACNEVYLIPHDKFMTISDGSLHLTDKENIKGPHLTINTFFNSLAEDCGKKAIGIVLSGLGSDGTEGSKAIKKAGGMLIARDPSNSEFGSMPSNAIATGLVDFVLEPSSMPEAIEGYVKNEGELLRDHYDDEKNLKAIIDLIKESSQLDFSDYKQATILRRTKRRATFGNFSSLANYLNFLKMSPDEVEALSKEFLISVTSFFRDKAAFKCLEEDVIPDLLRKLEEGEELKMWVAGCATGEEAYSLAILVAEQLTGKFKNTVVKIFATDIDNNALIHGGKGIYDLNIGKDISKERLEKYFTREGEYFIAVPLIRKMIIFAQHDLVKNPPYCNMHMVSCRNLLIYMSPILQKKIFTMLLFGLKMNGYLFLGSSENPISIIKNIQVVNKKWKIYKNLESKRSVTFNAYSLPDLSDVKRKPSSFSEEEAPQNTNHALTDAMYTSLANDLDYLSICVNKNNQVITSYGDTSKYLLTKHFTSTLTDLLPKPLEVAFNTLSLKAVKTNQKASVRGIKIKQGQEIIKVNLSVSPLEVKGEPKLLMVNFTTNTQVSSSEEDVFDEINYLDQYTKNLEEELKELKDRLNSSYERLAASNENMQSFNEELVSANEEMQSTNEEMQSVNEELHTINADYQLKNKELLEINDDLNNYFRSNINGQLFINNDLLLMKFSPGTVKQINLLPSDIGRPLSNISTNIKFETILDDIKEVLAEGTIITKEIETNNGKWYQVMTMPYVQQANNKRHGAIITFNDITELKQIQQELDLSNKMLGMAVEAAELGTWTMDIETREFNPSPRLKEMYGYQADETMTYKAAMSQIEGEHQFSVNDAVEVTIKAGVKYDVEYPLRGFHDGKSRWVRGIGNLSHDQESKSRYFTGVLHDITTLKQDEILKNDFIALVSHELKTPLTSLQAYVQLVSAQLKKAGDNTNYDMLTKAVHQVKKMAVLINGFLNVSSFEAGKIYLNKTTFEMNSLLSDVVEEIMLTTATHDIMLLPSIKVSVNADRDKISQVVNNFLSNAIKYSPKGKKIEISCEELVDSVQVKINDEGMGIKNEEKEKLFNRFYRIKNTNTKNISGFGLGLYLSAEIIQQHNGKLWVESEMGKGSTFYFNLPK
jgi:two-component system CheB/CheR fusion protein